MKRNIAWAGLSALATACALASGCLAIALLQVSAADDMIEARAAQLLHVSSARDVLKRQLDTIRRVPYTLAAGTAFGMMAPMVNGSEAMWATNRAFLRDVTSNITEGGVETMDTFYCADLTGNTVFGSYRLYEGAVRHVLRATVPGRDGAPGPIAMSLVNSNESWAEVEDGVNASEAGTYDARTRPWYQFAERTFNATVAGLAPGAAMPRDISGFGSPYVDRSTGELVLTAAVPLADPPYSSNFGGVCATDIGVSRLREKVEDTFRNQQLSGAFTMALVRPDGRLVFGAGGVFKDAPAAQQLKMNIWEDARLAQKGGLTHTLRRTWGDRDLAAPSDPIWATQSNTTALTYVTEDKKMLALAPLGFNLFKGEDLYVIVTADVGTMRVGLGYATAGTIVGSGFCIALLSLATMLSASPHKFEQLDRALSMRIGPIFLHWVKVLEPALVGLTLFVAFATWSLYLNSVLDRVTSDVAASLNAYAITQVGSLAKEPYSALTLLNAAYGTGIIAPHNQTNTAGQFGVQTYAAHACSTFRTATTCALATEDEVSGAYRLYDVAKSEGLRQVHEELGAMHIVSVKADRRYNLTTSWPPTADALPSRRDASNVSEASWYQLGRDTPGFKWSMPFIARSRTLSASLVAQASGVGRGQSSVSIVEIELNEVSRVLREAVKQDPTSIAFAMDVRQAQVTGVSSGRAYRVTTDGDTTPVTADAADNPVIAYVADAVLRRLGRNLTRLANGPLTVEVGTPDAASPTFGQFTLRAQLVGDVAPWAVVTASRKDVLVAASEEKNNSSIVYSIGVMASTILLAGFLRAGGAASGAAATGAGPGPEGGAGAGTASTAGEEALSPQATGSRAPQNAAISNADVEEAHVARIAKLKTRIFAQIWPLIGNVEAVMRPGGGRRWVGPSVAPRDPLWLDSPVAPQDGTLFHQLIAAAAAINRQSFAFGTTQFDALEEATGELQGPARAAAGMLRQPAYKVAALLLSSVHCTLALFDGSNPAVAGLDVGITLLRVVHVAAMWTHRSHVRQRGRYYRTSLLTLRSAMTLALVVDVATFLALGEAYAYRIPITSTLRPFLLATETDALVNSLASFFATVARSSDVFVFFFLFLVIATVGGMSLFADREPFSDFFRALFSMFNFMTTVDNYSDLVLSAGSASELRRDVIFYVIFAVVGFFVFISLVIAVFQETFVVMSNVLKQESELVQTARTAAFLLLHRATRSPSSDVEDRSLRTKPSHYRSAPVQKELSPLEADLQQLRSSDTGYQHLRIHRSVFRRFLRYSHPGLQAVVFSVSYPQTLDFDQFCSLLDQVACLPVDAMAGTSNASKPAPVSRSDTDTDTDTHTHIPTDSAGPGSCCRPRLASLAQDTLWRSSVFALLLLLAWLLATGAVYEGEERMVADWAALCCCYILTLEVAVRVYAIGPAAFFYVPDDAFAMYTNRLDAFVAVCTLAAVTTAQVMEGSLLSDAASPALRSVLTLPIFRVFAYFSRLRILFFSIIHVLGIYINMLVVLVLFTLSFSLLGTLTLGESFGPEAAVGFDRAVVNFDTPTAASGTLYQLMLQAEWGDIASTFSLFRGRLALVYFVVFIFVQGVLLANLFSGVLCEGFIYLDDLKSVLHHNGGRVSIFVVDTMLRGIRLPPLLAEIDTSADTLFIFARENKSVFRSTSNLANEEGAAGLSMEAMDKYKVGSFVRVVRDLDREVASAIRKLPVSERLRKSTVPVAPPAATTIASYVDDDEAAEDFVGALEDWANARLDALGHTAARALSEVEPPHKSAP